MISTSSASATTGWPGRSLRVGFVILGIAFAMLTTAVVGSWAPIAAPVVAGAVMLAGEALLRRTGLVEFDLWFWTHDRK